MEKRSVGELRFVFKIPVIRNKGCVCVCVCDRIESSHNNRHHNSKIPSKNKRLPFSPVDHSPSRGPYHSTSRDGCLLRESHVGIRRNGG